MPEETGTAMIWGEMMLKQQQQNSLIIIFTNIFLFLNCNSYSYNS